MKVLQVNCVYDYGSTGKLVADIHRGLMHRGFQSVVCYGRGSKTSEFGVHKICSEYYSKFNNLLSRLSGIRYGGCFFSTNKLISIIKREKPDIVHLHCINGYFVNIYRLISWLKKNHYKTVLTLHAEFMHTGGCTHARECELWRTVGGCKTELCEIQKLENKHVLFNRVTAMWNKMYHVFDGFESCVVTSVSPWLKDRAQQSIILNHQRHYTISNGVDTSIFHFYDVPHNSDEKVVLHVTPYFSNDPRHIKGGYYLLILAERLQEQKIKIIVVGDYDHSIVAPANIQFVGRINDSISLAKCYANADLTVITSKRETFSMVLAESLCCGTPVIGFKAGGPESIGIKEYSKFVDYGDIDALHREVLWMLSNKIDKRKVANTCTCAYQKEKMISEYLVVYDEMFQK